MNLNLKDFYLIQYMLYYMFFVVSFCFVIPFVHHFTLFQEEEEEVPQGSQVRLAFCWGTGSSGPCEWINELSQLVRSRLPLQASETF